MDTEQQLIVSSLWAFEDVAVGFCSICLVNMFADLTS